MAAIPVDTVIGLVVGLPSAVSETVRRPAVSFSTPLAIHAYEWCKWTGRRGGVNGQVGG